VRNAFLINGVGVKVLKMIVPAIMESKYANLMAHGELAKKQMVGSPIRYALVISIHIMPNAVNDRTALFPRVLMVRFVQKATGSNVITVA
jgi:hypothetical protein